MVAAGATVLMATSGESSSNGSQNDSIKYENQNICSPYNEISVKKNITPNVINSKYNVF